MSGGWINAWPLLLILAAGIAFGRWIERRRGKRGWEKRESTMAALDQATKNIASGNFLKPSGRDRAPLAGSYLLADQALKDVVQNVVAHFHIRDAAKNPDGSRGTIRISPDELRDALAFMARREQG